MEQPIILDGSQIRSVTAQGITYVDDDGAEQFIDFAQCYENYVKDMLSPERWETIKRVNNKTDDFWETWVAKVKKFKQVGQRQILTPPWADGPFIEFYTEPPMRFKFATEDEYDSVRDALEEGSWRTFDLS